jgi:hypothetical protein
LNGVRRVDRHLVVRRVPVLQAQVVVLDVDVDVGQDELGLDLGPDDAGGKGGGGVRGVSQVRPRAGASPPLSVSLRSLAHAPRHLVADQVDDGVGDLDLGGWGGGAGGG